MQIFELDITKDKGLIAIAEIVPPLEEQWYILAPSENQGWVSLNLPEKQILLLPLRPGAILAIAPEYQGLIKAMLGAPGLPTPTAAKLVFCNSTEYEELYNKYIYAF